MPSEPLATVGPVALSVKEMKFSFFDLAALTDRVAKAKQNALIEIGALTRTIARRSIRSRRRASAAGSPPSSHRGQLKNFLFFAYDAAADSVVVGPAKIEVKDAPYERHSGPAGGLLEFGGTSEIAVHNWTPMGWAIEKQNAARKGREAKRSAPFFDPPMSMKDKRVGSVEWETATTEPRPFMRPAFDEMKPKLIRFFRNML